ncbi:MAG TPA: sigma-70 family RNA polymerase sigma factor [Armatimonadota bacterium]|nr:sigma-70 family RNA polymerase sigma factor [Armatimonadota bacterium]
MVELSDRMSLACQNEDRKIFDELVHRHHKQAYNVAYRMTGNHADAEDLTQDTFLKAYRFFGNYKRHMPFDNWLYRIMSNIFIDWFRRRPKFSMRSLDEPVRQEEGETALDLPDSAEGPEALTLSHELDGEMQAALNTLSEDFRATVILSDIEGLSYEEISDVMGCSIGTVRSRLHRGRKLLREKLKSYLE